MSKTQKNTPNPENMPFAGEQSLKRVGKRHDPRFGDVLLFKNESTGRRVMCKEKASGDKKQFNADIEMARARMKIENPNLLKMIGWGTSTKKELCSTHHYVRMFFDYPESDLKNEYIQRRKAGTSLSGGELSNAANSALHGLNYIHSSNFAHGDVRPELISAEKVGPTESPNQFRVLDRLADPAPIPKAQLNNMLNNKELYMSPQLWKHINTKGKNKPAFDKKKNDLFALGMSLMAAGNKTSLKDCYKKGGAFDNAKLQNHLNKFNQSYANDPQLLRTVNNMVNVDEANRPNTQQFLHGKVSEVNVQSSAPPREEQNEVFEDNFVQSKPFEREENNVQSSYNAKGPAPVTIQNETYDGKAPAMMNIQNTHKRQANESEVQVEGDDFFNNPTPVYQQYNAQTQYVPPQNVTYTEYQPSSNFQQPHQNVTYTEYQPSSNFQQSHQNVTYVQAEPYKTNQSYTSEYKQSQPQVQTSSTVVTGEATVTYGKPRVVGSYIDHNSRRSYRGTTENTTSTVVKTNPSTTHYESESYIQSMPTTNTTYVQSSYQPHTSTTYKVESQPQTTTTYQGEYKNETRYVDSKPDVNYTVEKKKSTVFHDANFGEIQENGHQEGQMTQTHYQPRQTRTVIVRDAEGNVIEEREEVIE